MLISSSSHLLYRDAHRLRCTVVLLSSLLVALGVGTARAQFAPIDGAFPEAALTRGADGSFYSTTYEGGTHNDGTVFKIAPSGTVTVLHSFNFSDGAFPTSGLIWGVDGNFYGT